MRRGWILAGLGCALLGAGVVFLVRGRSRAPERDDALRDVPVDVTVHSNGTDSPTPQALEAAGSEPRAPESPANNAQPAVSGKTIPSTTAVDFLPYPNDGEAAFKQKYGAMDLDALAGPMLRLRDRLNEEVERLVQERYDKGLFDERVYKTPEAANADSSRPDLPQGMGQVWPCERATSQPDGSLKHWTTVLTEAEYPQLFAHQAEYLWVASTYHYMQKQAGKH